MGNDFLLPKYLLLFEFYFYMEGLEGKLNVQVVGYVKDFTSKMVELSIENYLLELFGKRYMKGFRKEYQ